VAGIFDRFGGSVKSGKFVEQLCEYKFLKKGSAHWSYIPMIMNDYEQSWGLEQVF
jgi:hypothetical protein